MRLRSALLALALAAACAQPSPTPTPDAARPVATDGTSTNPRTPPVQPLPPEPARVGISARATFGAVGDVMMHGAVKATAEANRGPSRPDGGTDAGSVTPDGGTTDAGWPDEGYAFLYAAIADELSQPDVMFANLETPIMPAPKFTPRSFIFQAPLSAANALKTNGIDLVSIANNHSFDQGYDGFVETVKSLDQLGLGYVGGGYPPNEMGPKIVEVNGLKVAWLAYAQFFNDDKNECPEAPREKDPCIRAAHLSDIAKAEAKIRETLDAGRADAVVVSVHWGQEYAPAPRPSEVEFAHKLAEAGALAVIGHHPHVLQPLEIYRRADGTDSLIAYSLGNFISNQSRHYVHGVSPEKVGNTRDAALLRFQIVRREFGGGVSRVELGPVDFLPLWTENDTMDAARKKSTPATIRVVAIDKALHEVRRELQKIAPAQADGGVTVAKADGPRFAALKKQEELYLRRKALIAALLGEDFLRELPEKK